MEPATEKLFWGLVVQNGKQYKQVPQFNFHLSMAVLDLSAGTSNTDNVQVNVNVEGSDFILCNLSKAHPQTNLDLIFAEGEKVKFYTTGNGNVHLTGYSMPDEGLGGEFDDEDFSDEESVDSEFEKLGALAANNKRKNTEQLKLTGKDAKKLKPDVKAPEPAKAQKVIDVDPKQLLQKTDNKAPDAQQKAKPNQANQPKKDNKPQAANNLAKKGLEEDSDDDDDDLDIDEDEDSVDINRMMMDDDDSEVDDDDLESDDEDLESDDDEAEVAKLKQVKGGLNQKPNQVAQAKPAGKPQQNAGSPGAGFQKKPQHQQQNKPQFQKGQNKSFGGKPQNKFDGANKTPQQNRGQTPQNKSQQKHQQTPFHKGQHNSNKKPFSPNQGHGQNKSFGGSNKKPFKKNA